eukprot:TRINITY_DN4604_c1_g1_i1.p1 TRINITY_DN4604_c1_g1~~TRINITY_DN4604_c1_g1_i1.p1  ORF type:complete len:477 (+),score=93.34 TRINITY_DN4604_c1_g1_i1:275-1705(+)
MLETSFRTAGLECYRQVVPLVGQSVPSAMLSFGDSSGSIELGGTLQVGTDFIVSGDYRAGLPAEVSIPPTPIVFVGFGISSPEWNWDDYKKVDVRNKYVLAFVNEPTLENEPHLFEGPILTKYGRWTTKQAEARRRGAKGIILIHTHLSAGYPFTVLSNQQEQVDIYPGPEQPLHAKIWIVEKVANHLLAALRKSDPQFQSISNVFEWYHSLSRRDFQPYLLPFHLSLQFRTELRFFNGTNVVGVLKSASRTADHVMVVAHHDHLGMIQVEAGRDHIYNGAEDNASGMSALLIAVKAFALQAKTQPLYANLVFVSTTAEESGLLGMQYYSTHPILPLFSCRLAINYDILNVYGPTSDVVGLGTEGRGREHLHLLFAAAANAEGLRVSADPSPGSGSFLRSDAAILANLGVPVIYIWSGSHLLNKPNHSFSLLREDYINNRYHQPSDAFNPDWDLEGALQQIRVTLRLIHTRAVTPL